MRIVLATAARERLHTAALVVYVFLLVGVGYAIPYAVTALNTVVARSAVAQAQHGIRVESQSLLENARALARDQRLVAALERGDRLRLLSFGIEEARRHGIDSLIVTDASGIVHARVPDATIVGDRLYERTAWGRAVSRGQDIASTEAGAIHALLIAGGVPVRRGPEPIGGVFTLRILDDVFARTLKTSYLPSSAEVVFFDTSDTVVGSSMTNQELFAIPSEIRAAVRAGVEYVQEISISGTDYSVFTVPLFGNDGEVIGRMMVLVPAQPFSVAAMLAALLSLVFFIGLETLHIYGMRRSAPGFFSRAYSALIALGVFLVLLMLFVYFGRHAVPVFARSPYVIYNSTLSFEPETILFDSMEEQDIQIVVKPGGESINAIGVAIHFDPKAVRVTEVRTDSSICDPRLIIEQNVDEKAGIVHLSCALSPGGFSAPRGVVGDIFVQPLVAGTFTLRFDEDAHVYANDGLATDVLRVAQDGSYQVSSKLSDGPIPVFSPTHPNPTRWYAQTTARFYWLPRPGLMYRYVLDDEPAAIGQHRAVAVADGTALVTASGDGTHYFRLAAFSATGREVASTTYRLQIDTTLPPKPTVLLSKDHVAPGEVFRLDFSNNDKSPNAKKGFYVKLDDGLLYPVTPPLFTAILYGGWHTYTVRVFDAAGNFSDETASVFITH